MALDDEAEPERKLQKLDNLPEVNPEVQSGADAKVAAVDADLAVVDGDEDMDENTMPEVLTAAKAESKMDVDAKPEEEEEDELEDSSSEVSSSFRVVRSYRGPENVPTKVALLCSPAEHASQGGLSVRSW